MYNRKSFGEGLYGHRSGNKFRELGLVALYIVRAVKKRLMSQMDNFDG